MPAVVVMSCSQCGAESHRPLAGGNAPLAAACSCGAKRRVSRFFWDRRRRTVPVVEERRRSGALRGSPSA